MRAIRGITIVLALVVLQAPVLLSQTYRALPAEQRAAVQEAETARSAWLDRRAEIESELSIQPYEYEEEFAARVERAVQRAGGRELRFYRFQLDELSQTTYRVPSRLISLSLADSAGSGPAWPLVLHTTLGFLRSRETFEVTFRDTDGGATTAAALRSAISRGDLSGEIEYAISGETDGTFTITLLRFLLNDRRSAQITTHSIPMRERFAFSASEPFTRISPAASFDFANGVIPGDFDMYGDADWFVVPDDAFSGGYSIRSGEISHNMESVVVYEGNVPSGMRLTGVSFARRVSSESSFDMLYFEVNGETIDSWSGELPWGEVAFYDLSIPSGDFFELAWVYSKDGSVDRGEDAAWIDNIQLHFE